jgi:hypothetical protein
MESSQSKRHFKPPWTLIRENSECYTVQDASGVTVAWLYCRDETQTYSFGASKLTSEEARQIGKAIARIPELMMQRQGFYPRGSGPRLRADRPYHVALEDIYIREHWDEIDAPCKLNSLPFNSTGETIQGDGVWKVYEFTWQMDAILFWDFKGRWLRGSEFHYPERPAVLETARKLAEVQSARCALTDLQDGHVQSLFDHDQPGGHASPRTTAIYGDVLGPDERAFAARMWVGEADSRSNASRQIAYLRRIWASFNFQSTSFRA